MKESYSINALCEEFEVHRSSYRYWQLNAGKIKVADVHTDSEVKAAHALSGGSAGSRTIATLVTKWKLSVKPLQGIQVNETKGACKLLTPKQNYKPAT